MHGLLTVPREGRESMKSLVIGLLAYVVVTVVWVAVENKPVVFVDNNDKVCGCMRKKEMLPVSYCEQVYDEERDEISVIYVSHC
jgi:hypothetical protein